VAGVKIFYLVNLSKLSITIAALGIKFCLYAWTHQTSLNPPPFIEVPVLSQESECVSSEYRFCCCFYDLSIGS
jgi:hypothetical protein